MYRDRQLIQKITLGSLSLATAPTMNLSVRRQRPPMTLSFGSGVGSDPKQKSLMFATEDKFQLNDCQDIDPNAPLERQEYVWIRLLSPLHAPNLSLLQMVPWGDQQSGGRGHFTT